MRATEFITEVTDKPYRYMLAKRTDAGNQYMFMTDNGSKMVVAIGTEQLSDGTTRIEVAFGEQTPVGMTLAPTGKGDAFKIFATVGAVVKDFLAKNKKPVSQLMFKGKASEPSRIRLYDKIARSMGKFIPGFALKGEGEEGHHKVYVFDKETAPA